MAAVLTLDTIANAEINVVNNRFYARRTGLLKGIDTTLPPARIFAEAINHPDMPRYFTAYPDPTYAYAVLTRHFFEPITNDKLRVTLYYEPADADLTGGIVFVVTRRTRLVMVDMQYDPKTKKPLTIKWTNTRDVQGQPRKNRATFGMLAPMQSVECAAFCRGEIPDAMLAAVGSVNDRLWRGANKGFWLCKAEDDTTNNRGRSYSTAFTFERWLVKDKDWSSYVFYHDPVTGVVLPIHHDETTAANLLAALMALPYAFGVDGFTNGVLRIMPYPEVDFATIFGFDATPPAPTP